MPAILDSLPAEPRLKIYWNLMLLDAIEITSPKTYGYGTIYNFNYVAIRYGRNRKFSVTSQLLQVSRLFYREAVLVLYGENLFIAGNRSHTLSFVTQLKKLEGRDFEEIRHMRFDGLEKLAGHYGLAVLQRLPRLKNLFLYGDFELDAGGMNAWNEAVGVSSRAGAVVKNDLKIHEAFPAFSQAAIDKFERGGTTITAVAKVPTGQTTYVSVPLAQQ